MTKRDWRAVGLLLLASVLSGWMGPSGAWSQPAEAELRVQPKDLLDVRVLEVPELNVRQAVSESGTIELPLVGSFTVIDLTAAELALKLEGLLEAKYVQQATVSVGVEPSRTISVL